MEMNTLIKLIALFFFISVAFGEFQLMKRTRDYSEAVDYLTLKIKKTSCKEFLKVGGLAERIKGGYSHHCLPIDLKGEDVDDFKFIGRCMDDDKNIFVTIVQIYEKRKVELNNGQKKGGKKDDEDDDGDYEKRQKMMKKRKSMDRRSMMERSMMMGRSLINTDDVEFYLTLKAGAKKPIEFEIKKFNLKKGHAYQIKRPSCLKARNHCERSKYTKDQMMVIDCFQRDEAKGLVKKGREVYIEITRRDERPDTCVDAKNGSCCRYVTANDNQGICKVYAAKGGREKPNKGANNTAGGKELGKNGGLAQKPNEDAAKDTYVKKDESVVFEIKTPEEVKKITVNDASNENKNINNKDIVDNQTPQSFETQPKSSSDDSNTTIPSADANSPVSTSPINKDAPQDEYIEMDLMVEDDSTASKRSAPVASTVNIASTKNDSTKKSEAANPHDAPEFDPFDEDIEFEVEDAKKNLVPNVPITKKENVQPMIQIKQ